MIHRTDLAASSSEPRPDCPTWCGEPHDWGQDNDHYADGRTVVASRNLDTRPQSYAAVQLFQHAVGDLAGSPMIELSTPDLTGVKLTLSEARELARVLIETADAAAGLRLPYAGQKRRVWAVIAERDVFVRASDAVRVTQMRLADALRRGDQQSVRRYEQQLAVRHESRLTALGEWMKAEGGRVPPVEVERDGRDLDRLAEGLQRRGGNLSYPESDGGSKTLAHFPQDDVPATLACIDALGTWERQQPS